MYAAGSYPDHVTRHNHKNPNRWLVQTVRTRNGYTAQEVFDGVFTVLTIAGLIVTAVLMLQGVA